MKINARRLEVTMLQGKRRSPISKGYLSVLALAFSAAAYAQAALAKLEAGSTLKLVFASGKRGAGVAKDAKQPGMLVFRFPEAN